MKSHQGETQSWFVKMRAGIQTGSLLVRRIPTRTGTSAATMSAMLLWRFIHSILLYPRVVVFGAVFLKTNKHRNGTRSETPVKVLSVRLESNDNLSGLNSSEASKDPCSDRPMQCFYGSRIRCHPEKYQKSKMDDGNEIGRAHV